jgi:hypothetical protein
MDTEKIKQWIERLNKADKKERKNIVAELAKENNLKDADMWQLLKLNGFVPKEEPQNNPQDKAEGRKQPVVLRHKTEYPKYRRAGLVLTQKAETYEVTGEQLAALKKDPWVAIGKDKEEGANA